MGHFFIRKNTKTWGGGRGRFGKTPDFLPDFFCETFPNTEYNCDVRVVSHLKVNDIGLGNLTTIELWPEQWKGTIAW